MGLKVAVILGLLLTNANEAQLVQAAPLAYYVAPSGYGNLCTVDKPCSLEMARDQVRRVNTTMTSDIYVLLYGGTYQLKTPFRLDQRDSGRNGFNVIYKPVVASSQPILSGGQIVSGWTVHDGVKNIWKAAVPEGTRTRQLYVNGLRAIRASASAAILGKVIRTATGYLGTDGRIQTWPIPSDLEFVYTGRAGAPRAPWTESRCGVASVSGTKEQTIITMQQPCFEVANSKGVSGINLPTSIENNLALLDKPGEWYLDSTVNTLYYIPRETETMTSVQAIIPTLETLVVGQGLKNDPIHNIHFVGLTFAYATWLRPSQGDGFIEGQANHSAVAGPDELGGMMPANVTFSTAYGIRFERNIFTHLGGQGLAFDKGSQNNAIVGNLFTDISGTGIRIGNVIQPFPQIAEMDAGNQVTNNYVHNIAAEYRGGVGIFVGYAINTTISHNEIAYLPYSGISVGWGWGSASYAGNNLISNNKIHDVLRVLADGAPIYVLGRQPGSIIERNWVYNDSKSTGALYLDNGSYQWRVRQNVVSNTTVNWIFVQDKTVRADGQPVAWAQQNFIEANFFDHPQINPGDPSNTHINNWLVTDSNWPPTAQDIMNQAGLTSNYHDLLSAFMPTNLALQQAAWALSEFNGTQVAGFANDNDLETSWAASDSDKTSWWEVDLGKPRTLTQIEVVLSPILEKLDSQYELTLLVSNEGDMSKSHVNLGNYQPDQAPPSRTWRIPVLNLTPYRYVALLVKTYSGRFYLSELRVIGLPAQ